MTDDFRLADWLVQPELNTLAAPDGQAQRLEPKVMALLVCLAGRAGQVVSKEGLIQQVWADRFVSDEVLTTTMFELRKALGDEAKNPRFIQTVPRKGYRLIAPVCAADAEEPLSETPEPSPRFISPLRPQLHPRWLVAGLAAMLALASLAWLGTRREVNDAAPAPIRSIAVLPLDTLVKDADHEAFACALTEALRTQLAKLQTLRVIARTSVVPYRLAGKPTAEIARELGVDALVEGAVLRAGSRVRVTAQFIHAPTDEHLWAESYEREIGDLLKVQDEIAQAIAQEVRACLNLHAQAANNPQPVAHEARAAYLRGRQLLNRRDEASVRQALEQFDCALQIAPGYALAHSGQADAYAQLVNLDALRPADGWPPAKAAALRAVQLDGQSAEAQTSLALVKFLHDRDGAGAEAAFQRALALNPSYDAAHEGYGHYLRAAGRAAEAEREFAAVQPRPPAALTSAHGGLSAK